MPISALRQENLNTSVHPDLGAWAAAGRSRLSFMGVALLIIAVGVFSTELRLPHRGPNTSASFTRGIRMAQCGGAARVPVERIEVPTPRIERSASPHSFSPDERSLMETAAVLLSHGLRAPPLA